MNVLRPNPSEYRYNFRRSYRDIAKRESHRAPFLKILILDDLPDRGRAMIGVSRSFQENIALFLCRGTIQIVIIYVLVT